MAVLMMRKRVLAPAFAAALGVLSNAQEARTDAAPAWGEVAGLLQSRCLPCHGGEEVRSGLRFATAATLAEGGFRGPVIDRADPAASRLLDVVSYANPELVMPPTGELPAEEIELLRRWVLAGAPWPEGPEGRLADPDRLREEEHARAEDLFDWWAYRPLADPEVPREVTGEGHPIDRFLEARRAEAGLSEAPRASLPALLRRATFDLIGLPPTPDELAAFEAAVASEGFDAAWAAVLDRLLASPHHGERWARHWLDLVRYAETNGYERDNPKTNAWRYRDWVVRAFQEDMPYDRFVVEQLAGDELHGAPPRSDEATGEELTPEQAQGLVATGYYRLGVWDDEPSDPPQATADELADIVATTGQVFLGTTVGCARCHDHKADPLTQREYYAVTAWFNSILGHGGGVYAQHLGGGTTRPVADQPGPGVLAPEERDRRMQALEDELRALAPTLGVTPPTSGEQPEPVVLVADARGGGPALWRYHEGEPPAGWETPAYDDGAWPDGRGGFGVPETAGSIVGTVWNGRRIQLRTVFRLDAIPDELVLSVHHDEDVRVLVNGREVLAREGWRTDYTEVPLDEAARAAFVVGRNVLAVECRQTDGAQYVDVGLRTGVVAPDPDEWLRDLGQLVTSRPVDDVETAPARQLFHRRRRLRETPVSEPYPALVVVEREGPPPVQHVLLRGSAHAPGDVVEPGVPAMLTFGSEAEDPTPGTVEASTASSTAGRRLAFARWLTEGGKHITARVLANRLWQHHFGRGLCRTPGDFGRLGELPTHPALLDHLAREVIERGWSLHAMHRYLMTSRAYLMDTVGDAASREKDPNNDLYWRFDPRRLTAEEYRDAILAVNGTLEPDLYGPSVTPPLPAEVLATASRPNLAWGASTPEEAHRRSLYVHVKRSLRPPLLEAFDQPDPDISCQARFPTNVPTQALITLNGDFVAGAADDFARRLEGEAAGEPERVERALELALGREAAEDEVARGVAFLAELEGMPTVDGEEALRLFCLALYNRNEFLWLD